MAHRGWCDEQFLRRGLEALQPGRNLERLQKLERRQAHIFNRWVELADVWLPRPEAASPAMIHKPLEQHSCQLAAHQTRGPARLAGECRHINGRAPQTAHESGARQRLFGRGPPTGSGRNSAPKPARDAQPVPRRGQHGMFQPVAQKTHQSSGHGFDVPVTARLEDPQFAARTRLPVLVQVENDRDHALLAVVQLIQVARISGPGGYHA